MIQYGNKDRYVCVGGGGVCVGGCVCVWRLIDIATGFLSRHHTTVIPI